MLQNEASLAIVAVHTAENEPLKIWGYSFNYSVTSLGTLQIEEKKLRELRHEASQNPSLPAQKLFYQEQEVRSLLELRTKL